MLDFRKYAISSAFRRVKKVVAVCSGKGGVGKSFIATGLAWYLKDSLRTGLLDLDIYGFSTHRFLCYVPNLRYESIEEAVPVQIDGLVYFSPVLLIGDRPFPVRGSYREKTVLDILSFVKWPELDVLIIDMPPGTGDEVILPCRYLAEKISTIVVTLPDPISLDVASRLVMLLKEIGVQTLGAVLNMCDSSVNIEKVGDVIVVAKVPHIHCVVSSLAQGRNPYVACPEAREYLKPIVEYVRRLVTD